MNKNYTPNFKVIRIVFCFLFLISFPVMTWSQDIVYPSNDSYTHNGERNTNFGSETEIRIKKSSTGSTDRNAYLSFNLNDFRQNYEQIILKLTATNNSNVSVLLESTTAFNENTLTWNSSPTNTNPIYHGGVNDDNVIYYDVTEYVNQMINNNSEASFFLYSNLITSPTQTFASKENSNVASRPQLLGYENKVLDMSVFNFTDATARVLEGEENSDERIWDATVMDRNNAYEDPTGRYGGLISCDSNYEATGYFRTLKIDNVWHFVDPDGNLFYSTGINSVRFARPSRNESIEAYNNLVFPDVLTDVGLNTIGSFSDDTRAEYDGIAYTPRLNVLQIYKNGSATADLAWDNDVLPVWEDDFEQRIATQIAGDVTPYKNDPFVIGYFLDNELKFSSTQLDDSLDLPSNNPQFQRADAFMRARYGSNYSHNQATAADNLVYVGEVAERYFSVVSAALKSADPNHLNLGTRINGNVRFREPVIAAAGRYVDVLSINYYRYWEPIDELRELWSDLTDLPWMTTEYYTKGDDTGFTNRNGAGWVVQNQEQRAIFFENWVYNIMDDPNNIGHHWFRFNDTDDNTGDGPSNKVNIGLMTQNYVMYEELGNSFIQLNKRKYAMRDRILFGYQANSNTCNSATITINNVTEDNVLNQTESEGNITITGTVSGDFSAGDAIILTSNATNYNATLTAAGLFSVAVLGSDLEADADNAIEANLGILATASHTYSVDTTLPVITLTGANPQTIELGAGYSELGATTNDGSEVVIDSSDFVDAVGSYTIRYNAIDASNNEAVEVTRRVDVVDSEVPVITLTGANPQTIELGVGYSELGATTNDGSEVVIDSSDFVDAVGSYTIRYNATDASGNNAVEVTRRVDVEQQEILEVSTVNQFIAAGETKSANVTSNISWEATTNQSWITLNNNSGTGNREISIIVSENIGNAREGTVTFIGEGITRTITISQLPADPEIFIDDVTDDNVLNDAESKTSITITGEITGNLNTGETLILRINEVNYNATHNVAGLFSVAVLGSDLEADSDTTIEANLGISATASHGYSVDTTLPVITLTGVNPQTIELGAGYTELGATANDGSTVVIDASDFVDAVGSYTIRYNTTDASGNNALEVTREVNVVDTTAPELELIGANPQTIELGVGYTELGATANDGSTVVIDASDFVDAVGSYIIRYNTTDASGNSAEEVTREVNVVDTTAPELELIGANPQTIELGAGYSELEATANDGSEVIIDASDFVDTVGSYTIRYNATDASNNKAEEVTRTVNVVDTTAPIITLEGENPQTIVLGNGYTELGATTNDGSAVVIDVSDFSDAIGSYTITYNATDAFGNNAAEVTRTVVVSEHILEVTTLNQFIAAGETKLVNVTSNISWEATRNEAWISIGNTSENSNGTINITVFENTDTQPREGTVTVTGGGITRVITISQLPAETILDVPELISFEVEESEETITVTSNTIWRITFDADWISLDALLGVKTNPLTITAQENPNADSRSTEIFVEANGIIRTITINQEGREIIGTESVVNPSVAYPNPFKDSITIVLGDEEIENAVAINIVDPLGRTIYTMNINGNEKEIYLTEYFESTGVYYVLFLDANNKIISVKNILKE